MGSYCCSDKSYHIEENTEIESSDNYLMNIHTNNYSFLYTGKQTDQVSTLIRLESKNNFK